MLMTGTLNEDGLRDLVRRSLEREHPGKLVKEIRFEIEPKTDEFGKEISGYTISCVVEVDNKGIIDPNDGF